ncbi:hypothetical protein N9934_04425 [Desulfosarcina sp.]|nr:hypothetical protein [Desulfosarcina sp.]
MNRTKLYIVAIIAMAAFIWPIAAGGQDLGLTSDGKVPGKPFEALQQQIDELRDIQTITTKAYTNNSGCEFPQEEWRDIISLSLPAGHFIMTMAINATFWHGGIYNPGFHTYLECKCVDANRDLIPGCGAAGGVAGHDSLVQTIPLSLYEATEITLKCYHNCGYDDPTPNDPMSMGIVWTAIEVDEIDNQFTP